ncbi:MAG: Flp family type IVb pilin [Alphaproteobacteria bacterium]
MTELTLKMFAARMRLAGYWRNKDGATAIEYGLIAAGIAVAIIAAIFALGDTISNFFNSIGDNISGAS